MLALAGCAPLVVHHVGAQRQVAHETEGADTGNDAVEEETKCPTRTCDRAEYVERQQIADLLAFCQHGLTVRSLRQVKRQQAKITETGQHPDDRWQVQEVVE